MPERAGVETRAAEDLAGENGAPHEPGQFVSQLHNGRDHPGAEARLLAEVQELNRRLRELAESLQRERAGRLRAEEGLRKAQESLENRCQTDGAGLEQLNDTVLLLAADGPLSERQRSPEEVFEDHLQLRQGGHDRVEEDVRRNFADNVIVVTNFGVFEGREGIRECAGILRGQLPSGRYEYKTKLVRGRVAHLAWSGNCGDVQIDDGWDAFVIENGQITVQTIHYTLKQG
jgi:hypothetical protein